MTTKPMPPILVKLLTFWDEEGAPFEKMVLCLSGQDRNEQDFMGYRNFFTKNGYPKPVYNAFVLAGKVGTEKLCFYLPDKTLSTERISVLPTRHPDGHLSILLAYGDDDMIRNLETADTVVELFGLDRAYRVSRYIIDDGHANAIVKYRQLGCPDTPTQEQRTQILDFARLREEFVGTVTPEDNSVALETGNNSVILLELYPEA